MPGRSFVWSYVHSYCWNSSCSVHFASAPGVESSSDLLPQVSDIPSTLFRDWIYLVEQMGLSESFQAYTLGVW